jgi:hypothetical protein
MKKALLLLVSVFLFGSAFGTATAQRILTLDFYYGATCPHCHDEMAWFPELQKLYPDLKINKYEVWLDPQNKKKMEAHLASLGQSFLGVPVNIIESDVVTGYDQASILSTMEKNYGTPSSGVSITPQKGNSSDWKRFLKMPWPSMALLLGLVDGFNPCAMWTLFILIGFLLGMPNKKKRWLIGGIFIASSTLLYFGALLAYYFGFSQISSFASSAVMMWIFRGVGALALFTGGKILHSARRAQIECSVRDADSRKKFSQKMNDILSRQNIWIVILGVIGLAFSVNSIELLCSFAIPTTFTASLVNLGLPLWKALCALLLYTFTYILDDLAVFLIAMWTLSLKVFSPKLVQWSHGIGGILLLLLGGAMLINPELLNNILG